MEKEVEKEVEKQLPSVQPNHEEDWNTAQLPISRSIRDLGIEVVTLLTIFGSTVSLKGIKAWPNTAIFATKNFHQTILMHKKRLNLDDYLRPVDALVVFPASGEVLLLSEREADSALEAFWNRSNSSESFFSKWWKAKSYNTQNFFINWALWRNGFLSKLPGLLPTDAVSGLPDLLQDASRLVSIQVFMGDTRFKEEAQKKELQDLVTFVDRSCGDARAIKELEPW